MSNFDGWRDSNEQAAAAEISAIADSVTFVKCSECKGLKAGWASVYYDGPASMSVEGPVVLVAAILRVASGRGGYADCPECAERHV